MPSALLLNSTFPWRPFPEDENAYSPLGTAGEIGRVSGSHRRQHVSMPPTHGGRAAVGRIAQGVRSSRRRANPSWSLAGIAHCDAAGTSSALWPSVRRRRWCKGPCWHELAPSEPHRSVRAGRRVLFPECPSPTLTVFRPPAPVCARRAFRTRPPLRSRRASRPQDSLPGVVPGR